jgi:hypothetical protein
MKLNVMLGLVASLSFTTVFGAAAFDGDDAELRAAIAASLEESRGPVDAALEAALAASMVEARDDAASAVRPTLSERQIATWFADTTAAIGSSDLRLINSTLLRLQSLEGVYDLTGDQAAQLTDNIMRLVQVVSDLESKAVLGSSGAEARSAARRGGGAAVMVTTPTRAAVVVGTPARAVTTKAASGGAASAAIETPTKSFAELRAMFNK